MADEPLSFHLRDAAPDDMPEIALIYAHYVQTTCFTFEEVPPSAAEMLARWRRLQEASLPWRIASGARGAPTCC